jgi:WS/DGAT/MGAT family acyltransferase
MHVAVLAIFESGPLDDGRGGLAFDRLCDYVESRLSFERRYRQRLAFTPLQRHPIWIDDTSFNLRYHVRHTSLPRPGSEEQLKQLAGRIMSQQLDREKPLWEMWFIEGLESERFALIGKVHHCMVDGVSGVGLLQSLLNVSTDPSFEPGPVFQPRSTPSIGELLLDEAIRGAAAPLSTLRAARNALRRPREASQSLAENAKAVWHAVHAGTRLPANTPLNQPIGTHRRVDWRSLDLAEVKDLKKRLDGTVNDVVLTVVAGAMRRFFKARRVNFPDLDFRIVVPVNMRDGFQEPRDANRVSALFVELPISERDPLRRFELIRNTTLRMKASHAAEGIDLFNRFLDWSGSDVINHWGTRLLSAVRPHNMIVTNVPGPDFPLYMLGAKLHAMVPQLPLFQNQGLGVAAMSYLGQIHYGLVADWDLVPDLSDLAGSIDVAFAELREAALKKEARGIR